MEPLKGWLQKKGAKGIGGGGWKRRYFRQYDDRIYYFRSEEDELSAAYGFINMADVTSVHPTLDKKDRFGFQANTPTRTYYLLAKEEKDMSYWLTGLVAIIQQANRTRVSKRISITTGNGDSSMPLLGSPPRDRALSGDGAAPEHAFAQPPRPLVPQLSVESEILVQGSLRASGERSEAGERDSGEGGDDGVENSRCSPFASPSTSPRSSTSPRPAPRTSTSPRASTAERSPVSPRTGDKSPRAGRGRGARGRIVGRGAARGRGRGRGARGRGGAGRGGGGGSSEGDGGEDGVVSPRTLPPVPRGSLPPVPGAPRSESDAQSATPPPVSPRSPRTSPRPPPRHSSVSSRLEAKAVDGAGNDGTSPLLSPRSTRVMRSGVDSHSPPLPSTGEDGDSGASPTLPERPPERPSSAFAMRKTPLQQQAEGDGGADLISEPPPSREPPRPPQDGNTMAPPTVSTDPLSPRASKKKRGMMNKMMTLSFKETKMRGSIRDAHKLEALSAEEATDLNPGPTVSPALKAAAAKIGEMLPAPVPITADDSHRTKIAKEILSTEITYCLTLETIISLYIHALRSAAATDKRIALPKLNEIFGNVELIFSLNNELLRELSQRVWDWDDATTCLGDIFLKVGAFLKLYAQYSNSYEQAIATYQAEMDNNPGFSGVVEECNAASAKDTHLHHLLIQPVQRVPRYVLLLQDLVKNTEDGHPDKQQLEKALKELKTVTSHINESVRATERSKVLATLAHKGIPVEILLEPHRHLIAGDVYNVTFKGNSGKRYVMLFNDLLVHVSKQRCKKSAELRSIDNQWPLVLVWVTVQGMNVEIRGPALSFTVHFTAEGDAEKFAKVYNSAIQDHVGTFDRDMDLFVRYGEFTYPNGGRYDGWWRSGEWDGHGVYSFLGNVYEGEFVHSKRDGTGVMMYLQGDRYEGLWRDGRPSGMGTCVYANGDKYTGAWKMGQRDGEGEIVFRNGDSYKGMWQNDTPNGAGVMRYASPEGKQYSGDWKFGLRHGEGKMEWGDGRSFEGSWQEDRPHGHGHHVEANGSYYEGLWRDGVKDGKGIMVYSNGRKYSGMWKNGKPSGQGRYSGESGVIRLFDGEWLNGAMNGKGKLVLANEDEFEGSFSKNKPHGPGVWRYSRAGITLEGKWSYGVREGKFTLRLSHDTNVSGVCKDDGLVLQLASGDEVLLPPEVPFFSLEFE